MSRNPEPSLRRRKISDIFKVGTAYLFSSFGVLILIAVIFFIVSKGSGVFSWRFLVSDYNSAMVTCAYNGQVSETSFADPQLEGVYFSSIWGVGLEDTKDASGNQLVQVAYVDSSSPMKRLVNQSDSNYYSVGVGAVFSVVVLSDASGKITVASGSQGAEVMASSLDQGTSIKTLSITSPGGGIRGSLLSTLLMIFFTLLLALPLGILGAVYLNQYAKDNRMNHLIRKMIDAAGGIPSIIYGLVGALIFIPLVNSVTKGEGGSLLSGAMTLAIMLLPTIISSTEEALKTIPASYAAASLALGASKTQTVFKVILPNATPGILTAVLLSIGRIIGESAALIYSCSTAIKDQILLTGGSATLAIHIWSLMGQENPDYSAAAGVALIILIADLLLNLTVKIIMSRFSRRFRKES